VAVVAINQALRERGERMREKARGNGCSHPVNVVAVSGRRNGAVVRVRTV